MSIEVETKIDAKYRPGSLSGVVTPGERFLVERISPVEVRMRLLEPAQLARPRMVKRAGRTVLSGGRRITQADVEKELENFP